MVNILKTDKKNILLYVRILILFTILLASIFLIIALFQKSASDKLTHQSIDYHFNSIHHIEVMRLESVSIRNILISSSEEIMTVSEKHEISQALYLVNKHNESLVAIQKRIGLSDFQGLINQLQSKINSYAHIELYESPLSVETNSLIAGFNSIFLTLTQLERLHDLSNASLLKTRHDKLDDAFPFLLTMFLVTFLIGTLVTNKILNSIKLILSEQEESKETLFKEKEWSTTTLASIGDAVITTDNSCNITYMNPIAERLTKWKLDEAIGLSLTKVFNIINEETGSPASDIAKRVLRDGVTIGLANHTVLISRDESKRAIEDSAAPIRDRKGHIDGIVIVFHDVSHARKMAQEMSWQASHDALTGLTNRHKFEVLLRELIDSITTAEPQHAFLYLDLDQFKLVNDTCGHVAGDELLKQVSTVLKLQVRDIDTVARLGGDEFGILLTSCPTDQAERIANQLRESIQEFRFVWEKKAFTIGASIGLVPITETMNDISEIMRAADIACYAAKDIGRNRVHIYQHDDEELIIRQGEMEWVSRINHALEEDRFVLYHQTIESFAADSDKKEHFEILLRMLDEEGEMISPMAFIPAAERYNLMPSIDRWVIRHAFTKVKQLENREIDFFAVNISGQSLGDDSFLEYVIEEFERTKLPAEEVCFEITETAAITNFPQAMHFISKLKEKGCLFALDDFGSGLSSFGYLKNLSVDFLKIDGTFVRDMLEDPIDHAMVESINSIGHTMEIQTIAEFVENTAIADELRTMGIDYGQGYGLSRPIPL